MDILPVYILSAMLGFGIGVGLDVQHDLNHIRHDLDVIAENTKQPVAIRLEGADPAALSIITDAAKPQPKKAKH